MYLIDLAPIQIHCERGNSCMNICRIAYSVYLRSKHLVFT